VHVECFTCRGCNQLIEDGVYVLEDGIEYHPPCVPPTPPVVSVSPVPSSRSGSSALPGKPRGPRAPKQEERCDSCQQLLSGPRFQLSNGKRYHPDCFACAGCKQRFDEGSYVCFEGREYHHHCVGKYAQNTSGNGNGRQSAESQLVCGACQNVIEGVFVKHNDSAYHPDCFCCSDCHKVITPRMPFGEIDTRPCCESCLERRFAESQRQQPQPGWSQYPPHAPQQHQQQYQPQPQQQRQHYPAHGGY
ncbi:LIM and senescent cell antigen-like-containing domain protein 1, partial [Linderina macrospora]